MDPGQARSGSGRDGQRCTSPLAASRKSSPPWWAGPHIGEIYWDGLVRPDVPDRNLHRETNHAWVSLLLHSRTTELDERADDHTVLVHVRRSNPNGSERPHASWPAEQIGQSVFGPPQE